MLEVGIKLNGTTIKTLRLFHHKGLTYVEELELRSDKRTGKPVFVPVFFQSEAKYDIAKTLFIGRLMKASYENGGNDIEANGIENIFVKGSLQRGEYKR